ncbi:MAG: MaoC family dehydratase [Pseudomonadota bacterium]
MTENARLTSSDFKNHIRGTGATGAGRGTAGNQPTPSERPNVEHPGKVNIFGVESRVITKDAAQALTGSEIGLSKWFTISQAMIDAYADLIEDRQFIHIDPAAARETPFGGTVAHGFLVLSLLPAMAYDALPVIKGTVRGVNYGMNRMRFVFPVAAGSRVRGRFHLISLDDGVPGEVTTTLDARIEIEGEERPAVVAEWINRYYQDEGQESDA